MKTLTVDSFLYDMGHHHGSPRAYTQAIIDATLRSWETGADLAVFPEYLWYNLVQYSTPQLDLAGLSKLFWEECWPLLTEALRVEGKAVILGSVSFEQSGKIRNRSPMIIDREILFQDKLCMTPWEADLDGGEEIAVFTFKKARCVNLICLDIEIPATADLLKQQDPIDLILVPSATDTIEGVERIARCASARSVELGAAVIVSQLVGQLANDKGEIDQNLGQASLYLPSLKTTENMLKIDERGVVRSGNHSERFVVDLDLLAAARRDKVTTNPAQISAAKKLFVKK